MTIHSSIGIVLYSTVVIDVREFSYFSYVVFLSVTMNHIGDSNPYLFVFNRTMDTIIGVGVAILANSVHLPRARDRETLFVSGIDHVLIPDAGSGHMVKELKKRFEPVSLAGWRRIIHF